MATGRLVARALLGVAAACRPDALPVTSVDGIPMIPIGYDAYRRLDELPLVRIGDRAYMRSTYDRSGGNEAADASHFVRQDADGTYVIVDTVGTGYLAFSRANHWHGSPWHVRVDDTDHVVRESSTATPDAPVVEATFLPADAFPAPLAVTWATTRGADLSWVPIAFTESLRLSHERTHYGTGYYIFHQYPRGADHLSRPLERWNEEPPPSDVVELFAHGASAPDGDDHAGTVDIPATGSVRALALDGPATIRKLEIEAPASAADALANAHLAIHWDGRADASVDAPIGLLFGAGTFRDREGKHDIVAAMLAHVSVDAERVRATLYFPMPYFASATIDLSGDGAAIAGVRVRVRTVGNDTPRSWQGYFHATFVDHGFPVIGQDLVVLDTSTVEGGEWCGTFNGMAFTFSDRASLGTLEGDPRMFFDDAESPQGHGTGTEEWAGGGDYWGGQLMTLALAGHPAGAPSPLDTLDGTDAIESAYRFLVADAMPFGKSARIQLEHGATDGSLEHYRTVAYWYGRPSACLRLSDTLDVGDPADEAVHDYASAGAVVSLTSSWDGLGVDDPAATDSGRTIADSSTFTVAIDPQNRGVLLRRTLDYGATDQRAEVWVGDATSSDFAYAGTWYTAGSQQSLYSNPPGELDPGQQIVQMSNRRWRDDEFLISRALTERRSSIRIQLRVTSAPLPLFPGAPADPAAWTEFRYRVYSYVL